MIQAKYQLRLSRDDKWHMDRPHFHEDVEILLSLSDGGDFFIENELYPLHCGTLLLVGEATLHKSIANDAYKRYVMHLPPSALHSCRLTPLMISRFPLNSITLSRSSIRRKPTAQGTASVTAP